MVSASVRGFWSEPSASITHNPLVPSKFCLMKAIFVPSGDHAGWMSGPSGSLLTSCSPVPSALMTHTSASAPLDE